ncbi:MAG: tyrosine-type recombinase/integrase [Bryobacterales bacterium]|nr:tyrosine-type recombinase/integrase [Bryobacterales bacterium]MBV9398097.1 tyrosine-type recombinase/integrase [Bryobacterales bacterium]
MTTATTFEKRLFEDEIEPFIEQLRAARYADKTLRRKRSIAREFAQWTQQQRITSDHLNRNSAAEFVARMPQRAKTRVALERGTVRLFLEHLCTQGPLQRPCPRETDFGRNSYLQRYEDYLRRNRGLANNSVLVYLPFIRNFVSVQTIQTGCLSRDAFDTLKIQNFLLAQTKGRSGEYARLLATSLRSFLRFLFFAGETTQDFSSAVPMVRKYRMSAPPSFLSPEQTERVLAITERSTSTGRRDYAVLLLLARLGLRAGEVVSLELDDIRWRSGEIVIRGKGRVLDPLPLVCDVGEGLAAYIRNDRGVSSSRRVFLRTLAPRIGLTGPAAVGHIVRRALARAGIRRSGRGAAHLFRHGLGAKMIRHGASLSEIAEVLRHRSQNTTAIYSQVSFEALRTVALPWPLTGGVQ